MTEARMATLFSADDLSQAVGGTMTRPFHADGVSIDTRTLQPGDLFVALQTETGDGHDHVATALAHGAAGALVHRQHGLPDDAPLVVVGDTLAGLTALGAYARARFTGSVVAITGSVGKTTTKAMLAAILSASGRTHAAVASYNNHWGVPLTLARMPPDHDYAVIEIGMNHPGEIAPLSMLAGPDVAVITTIEAAHIGHMHSLQAIAAEKASIAQGVLQGGAIVLPEDSPFFDTLRDATGNRRLRGFGRKQIGLLAEDAEGTDVTATIGGATLRFRLAAPGRHMVMNALAALAAADALDTDLQKAADALDGFSPVAGRGVRQPILDGRAMLIDESYNASTASVKAALSVLKLVPARRRVAVLGDMLELGDHSRSEHESLAHTLSDSADILYACGPWMKFLHDAVPPLQRGGHVQDSHALADLVVSALREGDVVLVKGSLGSRMRVVVDALMHAQLSV